jgi:Protein of unknown function (DUF5656)
LGGTLTRSQSGRRFNAPLDRLGALGPLHIVVGTTLLFALLLTLYVATGFVVAPLLAAVAVALGVDRLVRVHPQWRFHGPLVTVPFLFLPALLAVSSVLVIGESDNTIVVAGIGVPAVLLVALTMIGEYLTVDSGSESYEIARFLLLFSIYVTALLAFVITFIVDVPLVFHIVIVFVVTLLLTADMLREIERDSTALWIQAGAAALVMAECRWVVSFLSLSDVLAGVFMLLVYYPMTGLIQEYVAGRADRRTWTNWGLLFAAAMTALLIWRIVSP